MTYWISLPSATFRIESRGGYVVDAARIARHWVGCTAIVALEHYRSRGAKIDWIRHE
jgi:hypothetical protein